MIKTTNKQKIVLIIGGILFTLLFLEIGLRIGGFILLSIQDSENSIIGDNKDYRILTLGESTTADFIGNFSWPRQLEDILNNRSSKIKFKVFNEGVGGTNTAYILSNLEDNLDKYNPDIVITMMGANDYKLRVKYEESLGVKVSLWLEDIRVYKLSKLLLIAWKNKLKNLNIIRASNTKDIERKFVIKKYEDESQNYLELWQTYWNHGAIKAEEMFKKSLEEDPKNAEMYIEFGLFYQYQIKFDKAEDLFKKSIEINPENEKGYVSLGWLYTTQEKFDEAEEMFDKAEEMFKIEEMFEKTGSSIKVAKNISASEVTRYHHRKLYERLNKKGIKYVAMQYPMLDIEEIKQMFNYDENIIFVSNEDSFKEALRNGKYEYYFVDNFGGIFGHATRRGDKLIADNVANVILKELNIEN